MDEEEDLLKQIEENETLRRILWSRLTSMRDDERAPGDMKHDVCEIGACFLECDKQDTPLVEARKKLVERLKTVRTQNRLEAFRELQPQGALVYTKYPYDGKRDPKTKIMLYIPELEMDFEIAKVDSPPYLDDFGTVPLLVHKGELLFANPGRMMVEKVSASGKTELVAHEESRDGVGISALGEHQGRLYAASLDQVFEVMDGKLKPVFKTRGRDFIYELASNGIDFAALTNNNHIVNLRENGELLYKDADAPHSHITAWDNELYTWENYGDIVNLETGKRFNCGPDFAWVPALVPMQNGLAYVQRRTVDGDPTTDRWMDNGVYNAQTGRKMAAGLADGTKVISAVAVPHDITQKLLGS